MTNIVWPFICVFASSLALAFILTPIVREVNRKLGMIDKPDPRRINKVPIPRGGGVALVISALVPYVVFHFNCPQGWSFGPRGDAGWVRIALLSVAMAAVGYADDFFSLRPRIKLLCQVVIAFMVWWWADLGFNDIWPEIPLVLDAMLTVFWIVGAVNAFNLIDGLDGLASGLAFIAAIGMAGSLFFVHQSQSAICYLAFAGALLGFLKYNYNPASVFLGDCGSMFIGFVLSTVPLALHVHDSLMVSVGVPILAMGVPIFDTALAILRRTIRKILYRGDKSGKVMTADSDHLHHRILRASGLSQRKTALILYSVAVACVLTGLVAMWLQTRAGGLWLAALAVAAYMIFKDAKIELFDAGRLLNGVAHSQDIGARRRWARIATPFFIVSDILILAFVFYGCMKILHIPMDGSAMHVGMPIRVAASFACLVFFRAYVTIWSRAVASNYIRLALAGLFGAVLGAVVLYYTPSIRVRTLYSFTLLYGTVSTLLIMMVRASRGVVRDLFYALDCGRIGRRKDVSRILVYGGGLRYRAFRRELVRTTSANERFIVGIIDDDICMKGKYIGGIRICGTINDAPEIINELNVDAVVIACVVDDRWMCVVRKILEPTGVKVTRFAYGEEPVW